MSDAPQRPSEAQIRVMGASRAMLKMLEEVLEETSWAGNPGFYDRMEAVIKRARKAGITTNGRLLR